MTSMHALCNQTLPCHKVLTPHLYIITIIHMAAYTPELSAHRLTGEASLASRHCWITCCGVQAAVVGLNRSFIKLLGSLMPLNSLVHT